MASATNYGALEGINEASKSSLLSSGTSTESEVEDKSNERGFTTSCPAVLEPSKYSRRQKNVTIELGVHSWPPPSIRELSISSSGETVAHEDERQRSIELQTNNEKTDEPRTPLCLTIIACYNHSARKIRNSWFIYLFQFFVALLSASAIVMGIIHFNSCEGPFSFTDPVFLILAGISGFPLLYKWVVKVCRQRSGQRYWNFERDKIVWYIAALLFFMTLEYMFFSQISPIGLKAKREEVKCAKVIYDYLHYLHITNAGCLALAALLYLPDCCSYATTWRHLMPSHRNGHYQPL